MIAPDAAEWFGRNQISLTGRQAEMVTQGFPVKADDRDFLDRNRIEGSVAHCLNNVLVARSDATQRQTIERADRIPDARLSKRNRPFCGGADLRFTLPFDQIVEPEIEGDKRSAGEHGADDDRKDIPARNCAHNQPQSCLRPGAPVLVLRQSATSP